MSDRSAVEEEAVLDVMRMGDFVVTRQTPTMAHFEVGHTWCDYMSPVDDSAWEMLADFLADSPLTVDDFRAYARDCHGNPVPAYLHYDGQQSVWDYWYYESFWMGAWFDFGAFEVYGFIEDHMEPVIVVNDVTGALRFGSDLDENRASLRLMGIEPPADGVLAVPFSVMMTFPPYANLTSIGMEAEQVLRFSF